jgi:hypothetical protein
VPLFDGDAILSRPGKIAHNAATPCWCVALTETSFSRQPLRQIFLRVVVFQVSDGRRRLACDDFRDSEGFSDVCEYKEYHEESAKTKTYEGGTTAGPKYFETDDP